MQKPLFGKRVPCILLLIFLSFTCRLVLAQQVSENHLFSKNDTAFIPKEIEDPECLGINKEPAHATLMPYGSLKEARQRKGYSRFCMLYKRHTVKKVQAFSFR